MKIIFDEWDDYHEDTEVLPYPEFGKDSKVTIVSFPNRENNFFYELYKLAGLIKEIE